MLRVEMLPAGHGDALLVEYGDGEPHRILIDGGPYFAYDDAGGLRQRLHELQEAGKGAFELLIVTHVDTDHIDGIIRLLQDDELKNIVFKDIWFNGWKHIQPEVTGKLAGAHGEFLGALLNKQGLPWNAHEKLNGGPVAVPRDGNLPTFGLKGGAELTLLSPGPDELDNLEKNWAASLKREGFSGGNTEAALKELATRARYGPPKGMLGRDRDNSAPNGSSIAVVIEHDGDRALLAGDAWAEVLERSVVRYQKDNRELLEVTDFKLPHHGSFGNLTKKLLRSIRAKRYLVSSSSQYYGHPDDTAIKLILKNHTGSNVPELVFNYESPKTIPWADKDRQREEHYVAHFSGSARWEP